MQAEIGEARGTGGESVGTVGNSSSYLTEEDEEIDTSKSGEPADPEEDSHF